MLGLVNYSSSDEEGSDGDMSSAHAPASAAKTGWVTSTSTSNGPTPAFALPDAAALLGGQSPPTLPNPKRTVTQVTGGSAPPPRAAKSVKVFSGPARKGSAALLPPQLSGRKNIPTEDFGKMFTKKSLSGSQAKPKDSTP